MRRLIAPAAAALLWACASPGAPPGGPEDTAPPVLTAIAPDSGALNVRPERVLFHFDEVVSERPRGVRALEELFLVSPRTGEVRVEWRRRTLAVRAPRGGWRPGTAYTITMLPGVVDLRGNVLERGATTVFSTGAAIPDSEIAGVVFDWLAGRPVPGALVEAIARPDSVVFVTRADSSGRFVLPHLAPGTYTVLGWHDATPNRQLDPREPWDSLTVALGVRDSVVLHAFVHDTIGPGISELTVLDSLHLRVTFDRPLDVAQRVEASMFTLLDADSASIPVAEVLPAEEWEAREALRADTMPPAPEVPRPAVPLPPRPAAAAPDTVRADTLAPAVPVMQRPRPVTRAVVRLARPVAPAAAHRLRITGARNLTGWPRDSERVFTTPEQRPPGAAPDEPTGPSAAPPPAGARR